MRNLITLILILLSTTVVGQSKPLVVLDGYFITRDKLTAMKDIGIENIKDTTYIPADSGINLINEHGKSGLFVITTKSHDSKGFMGAPGDLYFNQSPLILIDQIGSSMTDLNRLNPAEIKSIRVRPPLEMVKVRGLAMVGGIVIVSTVKNLPLEKSLKKDSTLTILDKQVKLPTFQVELKLSELAEQELKISKETVVFIVYISGTLKNSNETNEFQIGEHSIELTSERIVTFDNIYVSRTKFEKLEDLNFEVLINVFSGRKSSQFNILNVEILQEPIEYIKGKRHFLKGRLVTER